MDTDISEDNLPLSEVDVVSEIEEFGSLEESDPPEAGMDKKDDCAYYEGQLEELTEKLREGMVGEEFVVQSRGYALRLQGIEKIDMNQLCIHPQYFEDGDTRLDELKALIPFYCGGCYKDIIVTKHLVCGGCKRAVYCSLECQAKEWTGAYGISHHKICGMAHPPGMIGRDILRLGIDEKIGSGLFTMKDYHEGAYVFITRPVKESEREVIARLHLAAQQNEKARDIISEAKKIQQQQQSTLEPTGPDQSDVPDVSTLTEAQKLGPGVFTEKKVVLDKLGTPIHTNEITVIIPIIDNQPLYISYELAMINHSCNPNCHIMFDNDKFFLTASRPIPRGEQLTIRYDDPITTLREDMDETAYASRLWSHYGIRCLPTCLCKTEKFWKSYRDLLELLKKMISLRDRIKEVTDTGETISDPRKATFLKLTKETYKGAVTMNAKNGDIIPRRVVTRFSSLYLFVLERLDGSPTEKERMRIISDEAKRAYIPPTPK